MKKNAEAKNRRRKRLLLSNIFLILAALLLIGGIVLILTDIIKKNIRNKKIEEATFSIEQAINLNRVNDKQRAESARQQGIERLEETSFTMVVDANALVVNGEENDFVDTQALEIAAAAVEDELSEARGTVTLTGIGILDIPSIDLHYPIWENTNNVTLRYGLGHYVNSVKPGQMGNCSILGHHLRAYGALFNRLEEVNVGDELILTNLRGEEFTYIVDETEVVTANEMLSRIRGGISDEPQVTLVTCTYTSQGKMRLLVIGHMSDGN